MEHILAAVCYPIKHGLIPHKVHIIFYKRIEKEVILKPLTTTSFRGILEMKSLKGEN